MHLLASYPCLRLYHHPAGGGALEAQWTGAPRPAARRRATLACVTRARALRVAGWVADDRHLGPVPAPELAWIAAYVLPLLGHAGVVRFARLEALDPRTQRVLAPAQAEAAQRLPFALRAFADPAEARAWACGWPDPGPKRSS